MAEEWGKPLSHCSLSCSLSKTPGFPRITDAAFTYLTFSGVYVTSGIGEAILRHCLVFDPTIAEMSGANDPYTHTHCLMVSSSCFSSVSGGVGERWSPAVQSCPLLLGTLTASFTVRRRLPSSVLHHLHKSPLSPSSVNLPTVRNRAWVSL